MKYLAKIKFIQYDVTYAFSKYVYRLLSLIAFKVNLYPPSLSLKWHLPHHISKL